MGIIFNTLSFPDIQRWDFQGDFKAYYYATKALNAGLNPYDIRNLTQVAQTEVKFNYVYLPIALLFFQPIAAVDLKLAFSLFLIFKCLLLASLVYLWRKYFLGEKGKSYDLLFYLFLIRGTTH